MANTKSAKKRALKSEQQRKHNTSLKSKYRTYIREVQSAIIANKKDKALSALKEAIPVIDKMVTKKILTKNKAARYKNRLNIKIKKIA